MLNYKKTKQDRSIRSKLASLQWKPLKLPLLSEPSSLSSTRLASTIDPKTATSKFIIDESVSLRTELKSMNAAVDKLLAGARYERQSEGQRCKTLEARSVGKQKMHKKIQPKSQQIEVLEEETKNSMQIMQNHQAQLNALNMKLDRIRTHSTPQQINQQIGRAHAQIKLLHQELTFLRNQSSKLSKSLTNTQKSVQKSDPKTDLEGELRRAQQKKLRMEEQLRKIEENLIKVRESENKMVGDNQQALLESYAEETNEQGKLRFDFSRKSALLVVAQKIKESSNARLQQTHAAKLQLREQLNCNQERQLASLYRIENSLKASQKEANFLVQQLESIQESNCSALLDLETHQPLRYSQTLSNIKHDEDSESYVMRGVKEARITMGQTSRDDPKLIQLRRKDDSSINFM